MKCDLKGQECKEQEWLCSLSPAELGCMRGSHKLVPGCGGGSGSHWLPQPHLNLCGPPLVYPPHTCQFQKEKGQKGFYLVAHIIAAVLEEILSQRGIAKILSLLLHMFLLNLQSCQTNYSTEPWNCVWACVHTAFPLTDAVSLCQKDCTAAVLSLFYHFILYFDWIFFKCLLPSKHWGKKGISKYIQLRIYIWI